MDGASGFGGHEAHHGRHRHGDTREPAADPLEVIRAKEPVRALARDTLLVARDGRELSIEESAAPLSDADGALLGLVLVFRNVTERKRAEARRRFIAESSARLSTSLDYQATLATVAHLAVEGLAKGETLQGKRIVIVEDVTTTGGSAMKAVEAVREAGGIVALVFTMVDREEGASETFKEAGLPFRSLYKAREFLRE